MGLTFGGVGSNRSSLHLRNAPVGMTILLHGKGSKAVKANGC
jgi:hypothetical protein